VRGDSPCSFTTRYTSVIGFGTARLLNDELEKALAMNAILRHYSAGSLDDGATSLEGLTLVEITIDSLTGKRSPALKPQR